MRDILLSRYLRSNVAHKQLARTSLIGDLCNSPPPISLFTHNRWLRKTASLTCIYMRGTFCGAEVWTATTTRTKHKTIRLIGKIWFLRFLFIAFFIRPFYKMMLGKPITLIDMESVVSLLALLSKRRLSQIVQLCFMFKLASLCLPTVLLLKL